MARALEKGSNDRGIHGSRFQTCRVQRWAEHCLSSALASSLVSSESNSLGSAQTSMQIPLGSLLDTLTHMCCFRIKELGTIDRWVRPNGQSRGRASESAFADLSGVTGPLALSSPQPDPWIAQLGPGNYQVTSQSHQVASLGRIPQALGSMGPATSTAQFFLLVKPLPPLPPFSLVLHSHLSPLASESIL